MKKLTTAGVAVFAAVSVFATSCSDPGAGGAAATDTPWNPQTTDLSGTTLSIWVAESSASELTAVSDSFSDATGATVDIVPVPGLYEQVVQTKVATGDKPDLALGQPISSQLTAINARQNLLPLTDAPGWTPSIRA